MGAVCPLRRGPPFPVTEKFHRPLLVGSVPVYRGAATWRAWAPSPAAVIPVADFATPKDLAAHLTRSPPFLPSAMAERESPKPRGPPILIGGWGFAHPTPSRFQGANF